MTIAGTKPAGWPTYPTKPAYQAKPHRESAATPKTAEVARACRELSYGELNAWVAQTLSPLPFAEALVAADEGTRLGWSSRINEILEILANPEVPQLAEKIADDAKAIVAKMLMREIGTDFHCANLAWANTCSNRTMYLLRSMSGLAPQLMPHELNDYPLLLRLQSNAQERKQFIAERQSYSSGDLLPARKARLLENLRALQSILIPIDQLVKFPSAARYYYETIPQNAEQKDQARGMMSPLWEIEKLLSHDIHNTFFPKMYFGKMWQVGHPKFELNFLINTITNLPAHLAHFRYVLELTRYRLDGTLPAPDKASFKDIVKAAVVAAGYRFNCPVNAQGGAGHIGYHLEETTLIPTHSAFLALILYNLVKNSIKAVYEKTAENEEPDFHIDVNMKQQDGMVIINVTDDGTGFNIDRLIKVGQAFVDRPENQKVVQDHPVLTRLREWKNRPQLIRSFTIGEILDLAFVTTISGFSNQSISSGLGLDEVNELAQLMGADIMLTNQYSGGAVVSIVLGPQELRHDYIRRELAETA